MCASHVGITTTPYSGAMAHRLEVVAVAVRDGELIVSMTCEDCPDVAFGSRRQYNEDDILNLHPKVDDMLASVQSLHEIDLRYHPRD